MDVVGQQRVTLIRPFVLVLACTIIPMRFGLVHRSKAEQGSEGRTMANNEPMPITGGCLCGAVRFEGEAFMRGACHCHCTTCQKSSGEPFEIGVPIKAGTLRFTMGAPIYYQSSSFGKRGFCAVWVRGFSGPPRIPRKNGRSTCGLRARQSRRRTAVLPHLHRHEASVAQHP